MAERPEYQIALKFKSVQIFKDQSLGIGSYGAVCKAKCDDLVCAAKIIHPTLFDPTVLHQMAPHREHRLPIRRFELECEFMSAMRHPNIVQYLGMFRDTNTRLPVLLMELMDDSLTHFLESSSLPIPYHIQINFCHDIALALSFLHSNNIVHRDLSSNNVLLRGNVIAKVTDFGMARLSEINPRATHLTSTMCPGTNVYMPPEAVQDKPVYAAKIDCFSFGVVSIQILTRQFPNPGDRLQRVELQHPGLPTGSVLVEVSEVNRRQNHISQVDSNHSLLPIALHCLKDKDSERPSAHELCERVADLKRTPNYRDSTSKEGEIQHLGQPGEGQSNIQQVEGREMQLGQVRQQLRQLQQQYEQALREKGEKERQLGRVNQQLEASEQAVARFERRIAELEQQLRRRELHKIKARSRGREMISVNMRWRRGISAPCKFRRQCDSVVKGNTVYVRKEDAIKIYSYDAAGDSWSQLPVCAYENGSLAIVNGWLTTIGGALLQQYTNELFSLTGEDDDRRWTKKFPPMPTKRMWASAVYTESSTTLIVAGGNGDCGVLSTVEVLNTENDQWSTVADLPEPMYQASVTICGDQLYLLGGINKEHNSTKSVYTCSVNDLIQSSNFVSRLGSLIELITGVYRANVWSNLPNLPFTRSTCESFHGQVLAVGGCKPTTRSLYTYSSSRTSGNTAVYTYNSSTNSWEIISHMEIGLYECCTAVLPDNQLMVLGGNTDRVDFATMCN